MIVQKSPWYALKANRTSQDFTEWHVWTLVRCVLRRNLLVGSAQLTHHVPSSWLGDIHVVQLMSASRWSRSFQSLFQCSVVPAYSGMLQTHDAWRTWLWSFRAHPIPPHTLLAVTHHPHSLCLIIQSSHALRDASRIQSSSKLVSAKVWCGNSAVPSGRHERVHCTCWARFTVSMSPPLLHRKEHIQSR